MNKNSDLIKQESSSMPAKERTMPSYKPLVDIYENDDEIMLVADMPGVMKEDISVNIDNGQLEISGVQKFSKEGISLWEEFTPAEYHRIFSIPQSIDMTNVGAELKDGVLQLKLPKSAAAKPKTIEIKTA